MAKKTVKSKKGKPVNKSAASSKTAKKTKAKQEDQTTMSKPKRMPSAFSIFSKSTKVVWQHKKLFIFIILIFMALDFVLGQGLSSGLNVSAIKDQIGNTFSNNFNIFALLIGSTITGASASAEFYSVFLVLITSLAIIWALRQVMMGNKIRVRDAFYKGMYPLITFILVLLVVALEFIPIAIGSAIYVIVSENNIATTSLEQIIFIVLFLLFAAGSFFLLSSSLIALYIITLPDMTPIKALRSARHLVSKRRLLVVRKILFLPFALIILAAVIMLPIISFAQGAASWLYFILTSISLLIIHSYMYNLYRELLEYE